MNKDKYSLSLKLKLVELTKRLNFRFYASSFWKEVLKYSKQLRVKIVKEPYILCKISIRSLEQCLAYRSNFFRWIIFYKPISIYSALVFVTLLETGAHMLKKGKM